MSKPRGDWKRHFLINRRADWLKAVMADPDLAPQDKCAAYAISLSIDEKTFDTRDTIFRDDSQADYGRFVGMQPRPLREALKALEAAGYIKIVDRGRLANGYVAFDDPADIERRCTAAHRDRKDRRSNARQNRAEALKETQKDRRSNARQNPASDIGKPKLTSPLSGDPAQFVRRSDVDCPAIQRTLSGDRSPHLPVTDTGYSGAASGGAPPSVSDNDRDSELRSGDQSKRPEPRPNASRSRPGAARSASSNYRNGHARAESATAPDDEHAAEVWDDDDDIPF